MVQRRVHFGAGWAFPLRTDSAGGIALVTHEREIEESIRLILGTSHGERPMRPEFGCGIHDEIFALATPRLPSPDRRGRAPFAAAAGSRGSTFATWW